MANEKFKQVWAKIVAKAWSDPNFKKKLLQDPKATLRAEGIEIPKEKKVIINESTKETLFLTIPEKPEGELSEQQLHSIAAGDCASSGSQGH
jgi:hypothetical protein